MAGVTGVAIEIINNVRKAVERIPQGQISKAVETLLEAQKEGKKVMVIGMGRSGMVGRAFAMRLMHLGFIVHVIGETITPTLHEGDILLAISGSGVTTFVVDAARIAKKVGARIISITSHPKSPLGDLSDLIVFIPGRIIVPTERRNYFSRQILGEHEPLLPLGTLFEITSAVFLDSLIIELMRRLRKTEEELKARHATIE